MLDSEILTSEIALNTIILLNEHETLVPKGGRLWLRSGMPECHTDKVEL